MIAANGIDATDARIVLPLVGVWHADLTLAAADGIAVGDAVTIGIGDSLTLKGTATRAESFEDVLRVRVVAGAAGLAKDANAKFYQGAQVRLVLGDILGAAGESLDAAADAGTLGTLLPNWSVLARPVAVELTTLLGAVASTLSWRVLAGGALWLGTETWPDSDLGTHEVTARDRGRDRLILGSETPTLLPGTKLDGERIGDVEHIVTASQVTTIARLA